MEKSSKKYKSQKLKKLKIEEIKKSRAETKKEIQIWTFYLGVALMFFNTINNTNFEINDIPNEKRANLYCVLNNSCINKQNNTGDQILQETKHRSWCCPGVA